MEDTILSRCEDHIHLCQWKTLFSVVAMPYANYYRSTSVPLVSMEDTILGLDWTDGSGRCQWKTLFVILPSHNFCILYFVSMEDTILSRCNGLHLDVSMEDTILDCSLSPLDRCQWKTLFSVVATSTRPFLFLGR